jgi:hypothetical protein
MAAAVLVAILEMVWLEQLIPEAEVAVLAVLVVLPMVAQEEVAS